MSTPVSNIKADIKAEESKLWAWLKANWAHFVTWVGLAYNVYKHL
jgi:hypothetical protein